jgi:hypothetical protein
VERLVLSLPVLLGSELFLVVILDVVLEVSDMLNVILDV